LTKNVIFHISKSKTIIFYHIRTNIFKYSSLWAIDEA